MGLQNEESHIKSSSCILFLDSAFNNVGFHMIGGFVGSWHKGVIEDC